MISPQADRWNRFLATDASVQYLTVSTTSESGDKRKTFIINNLNASPFRYFDVNSIEESECDSNNLEEVEGSRIEYESRKTTGAVRPVFISLLKKKLAYFKVDATIFRLGAPAPLRGHTFLKPIILINK